MNRKIQLCCIIILINLIQKEFQCKSLNKREYKPNGKNNKW